MIRQLTLLAMCSTLGSGLYLYSAKHKAELLDREIARNIREAEAARERTGLLTAEWALVNEPQRLGDLANKYLSLKPMAPTQFVSAKDLASRLPPVMSAADAHAAEATDDDAPMAADTPAPAYAPANIASDANPVAPPSDPGILPLPPSAPAQPAAVSVAAAEKPKAVKLAVKAAPKKPAHPVALASGNAAPANSPAPHDGPLAHGTPLPLAAPQAMRPQVMQAMARPAQTTAHPAVMSASPRYLGQVPFTGSVLVHSGALPPPTPLAPGAQ